MKEAELSFGEMIQAIRCGDLGCLAALCLECLIMLSPVALLVGAIYAK